MDKNLSNWLVASDIDGTLNNKLRILPKRNYQAINRFVNDLHGNFTLASGRGIESMRPHYEKLPIRDVPAIIINGAGIYDYGEEKLLFFNPIGEQGRDVLRAVMKRFPTCEVEIVTPEINFLVRPRWKSLFMLISDSLPHKSYRKVDDVPFGRWGKVIFIDYPWNIRRIIKYIKKLENDKLEFMSSSIVSYEMLSENTNKGTAVMRVAENLGINMENTAAIGDYFNDYAMLKVVGVPACCSQAPKGIHEIARFHACHCNKGAVADLLEHIEKIN